MHVPDHVMDPGTSIATAVVAGAALTHAVRRVRAEANREQVAMTAVASGFVFAAQMVNYPVAAGTSGHLIGAALAAALVGPWLGALAVTAVLVVQAVLFADGGITALGANVLNMGVVGALLVGGLITLAKAVAPKAMLAISAVGAWLAVMAGAAATAFELALSGTVPLGTVLPAMLGTHALIGVGEAVITLAAVSAVLSTRQDLVRTPAFAS